MMRRVSALGWPALVVTLLTIVVTWPQAWHASTRISEHFDARFSIWRLGWIAHALRTDPRGLFDANIFHPAPLTLAFSDATMLQGVLAAPLFWMGASPLLIYNLVLFGGYIGSGLAMFILARHLTRNAGAGLVAAAIFTVLPYRTEHFMHLEMQWAMFIPLTFWALHQVIETRALGWAVVAGVFMWLQVLSCVYYGIFLGLSVVAFVIAVLWQMRRDGIKPLFLPLAIAAVVAMTLVVPYAIPYALAARDIGVRPPFEIALYSAQPINYLASPTTNWLWGWTANRLGSAELRLFPGLLAILLGLGSAFAKPKRPLWLYFVVLVVALAFSFGTNIPLFAQLLDRVQALRGLRSLSRFAIVVSCALAVLAAVGTDVVMRRWAVESQRARLLPLILCACVLLEGMNRPLALIELAASKRPEVYELLRKAAPGVVLELPIPRYDALPGYDPTYQVWSLWHWKPLVNGYSGYYPRDYVNTMIRMEIFPETASINRLRAHGVRYIVIHRALFSPERLSNLMVRFTGRSELKPWGTYEDPVGLADVYELTY
jgi:hypothetical protein